MSSASEADPLRELLHHMTARYLTVCPGGVAIEGSTRLRAVLDVQVLAYGGARSLYRGRRPVCRSLDGVKAIEDSEKRCAPCLDRKHCTPQVRIDLLYDHAPYRLLLAYSSARNFLLFAGQLGPGTTLSSRRVRIRVLNRGSWGELALSVVGEDHLGPPRPPSGASGAPRKGR